MATVLSALAVALVALTPGASAQEDPGVTRARDQLARAQADAAAAQARYEQAVAEREQAQVHINELEQTITSTQAQEAALRAEIGARAAALYKNTDPSRGLEALGIDDRMDAGRRTKFTEVAEDYYEKRAQQLHETADQQQKAQADLEAKRTELDDVVPRLEQERAAFEQRIARATRGLEVVEQVASLRAQGEPLMGPTVLTAAEMAAWLRSSGASPQLSGDTSIEQLAQMFIDEGTAENVRGDFAFAQAYIETGGFSAGGSDNNFSGLGACDGCAGQNQFPNALEGIRAQIQLLKAYAGGGALVNPPSPYWWRGDPARAYTSFGGTGAAPTWHRMGGGNWATDPSYAGKVIGVYHRMIGSVSGS